MHRYRALLLRPFQLLPVLIGISIITFVLVRLIPGDPARVLLGTKSTPEAIARIRAQFGLDEPLWLQYFYFVKNLLAGEMGTSILYRTDVLPLIGERLGPTVFLVLGSAVLAIAIALPFAALAALRGGGIVDSAIRLVSTMGLGFPPFWLGINAHYHLQLEARHLPGIGLWRHSARAPPSHGTPVLYGRACSFGDPDTEFARRHVG